MIIQQYYTMFIENLKNFINIYGRGQKLKLVGFSIMSFFAGLLEFLGVALIYPFILLIIQPDNGVITKYIHIENSLTSGLLLGLCVLLIFIFKNTFIILNQYLQAGFVINWKNTINKRFMKYFLYAPYRITMQSSADDKFYILNVLCSQAVENFVMRILNLTTNIVILFMILLLLLIKFTIPAIITIVFVAVAMYVQNKFFKSRTSKISMLLAAQSKELQTSVLENINNIKEIKILSSEDIFFNKYNELLNSSKKTMLLNSFYSGIPPYFIEILVVVSLILMAFILSSQMQNQNSEIIASFAIIVAAIFRIAPALNRIQSNIIGINTTREFVRKLNIEADKYNFQDYEIVKPDVHLNFEKELCLKNVKFSYNSSKPAIQNITLSINKGDFVGIIGLSGAGKSTLADVITGLLPIDSGHIYVDDTELSVKNFPQFRKLIGYVPQQINVLNCTIRENVAWGCKNIDDNRVIKVLKEAQIYDVINEYPDGIYSNMIIDSTGLSQGQKQRLAIARALYREPEIIILDEATSALDVQVEHDITEMLTKISKQKTIIAIAHRLSTLKSCNKLVYMKEGKVIDIGTFEELSGKYSDFAQLVNLSKID